MASLMPRLMSQTFAGHEVADILEWQRCASDGQPKGEDGELCADVATSVGGVPA